MRRKLWVLFGFLLFSYGNTATAFNVACSASGQIIVIHRSKEKDISVFLRSLTTKISSIKKKIRKSKNINTAKSLIRNVAKRKKEKKELIKKASSVVCSSNPVQEIIRKEIPLDPCQGMINPLSFGAKGINSMDYLEDGELAKSNFKGSYKIGDSWDLIGIQEAILSANQGDTVCVPKGKYNIFRNKNVSAGTASHASITVKSGISIIGISKPIIQSPLREDQSRAAFKLTDNSQEIGSSIRIAGLHFSYGFLLFSSTGSDVRRGDNIVIEDNEFDGGFVGGITSFNDPEIPSSIDGTTLNSQQAGYVILISKINNAIIRNNIFRRDNKGPGRGIALFRTTNASIINNQMTGHFITAINVAGGKLSSPGILFDDSRNISSSIMNNIISRTASLTELTEDHGIYVVYGKNISIKGNQISGFSLGETGGSVKARNGEQYFIEDNFFKGSGVFLYNYDATGFGINYLRDVVVARNVVDQCNSPVGRPNGLALERAGIFFWSNISNRDANYIYEDNIKISSNKVHDGIIKVVEPLRGEAFSLIDNTAFKVSGEPVGVFKSGNIEGFVGCQ